MPEQTAKNFESVLGFNGRGFSGAVKGLKSTPAFAAVERHPR
jgi:hypothetical protein